MVKLGISKNLRRKVRRLDDLGETQLAQLGKETESE